MKLSHLGLAAGLTLLPVSAWAADGHDHAHSANGGQVQKIGVYEGELVVKGSDITLYVRDEQDKTVDATTFSATAIVLAKGNEQKTVELKPAGDNKLAGKVDFPLDAKIRATVSLKAGTTDAGKGRYTLEQK